MRSRAQRNLDAFLIVVSFVAFKWSCDAQQFSLAIRPAGSGIQLSWPSALNVPQIGMVFPEYEVQRSADLIHWEPVGGKVRGITGQSGPTLNMTLDTQSGAYFYRLGASLFSQTGSGGAEVFGYGTQLAAELAQLGLLPISTFASNHPPPQYLPGISWDPTSARFWTNFNTDPAVWNANLPPDSPDRRLTDFRLDTNELPIFLTNGFVVSERLGTLSFAESFYRVFNDDLPVFVSADSALHAWHRTYVSMLEELEELELATLLESVISNMSSQLPQVRQQYGAGPLGNSILDADYFLTVARSLWAGQQVSSSLRVSSQDARVNYTLSLISTETPQYDYPFGTRRLVDYSQFKVRGHYVNSVRLSRYFQTTMWCGRIDLRLATFYPNQEDDIRQLGTAIVLNHLLRLSGQFNNWSAIEQTTRAFVGVTDSMTFAQLGKLLADANIQSPADVPNLLTLTNLQTRLLTGQLGVQDIRGDLFYTPLSPEQAKLPRSFTVCGQKFALDSWALSQVTYDSIHWSPDYSTNIIDGKVVRRKPSCLDVGFSVFGNDQTVPDLVARITNSSGVPWRDGLPYQHNLSAVRNVIDGQDAGIWTNNIYDAWIAAIRALSEPTIAPEHPEAMRTRAWAMKTMNAQFASWTELRHDTLLYVQPSYTANILCDYPAGFVETVPEFWQRIKTLAFVASNAIAALPLSGTVTIPNRSTNQYDPPYVTYDLGGVRTNETTFLGYFATTISILEDIAEKELVQQPLNQTEADFLKDVVEIHYLYSPTMRQYNGWYPNLFFRNVFQQYPFGRGEGSDQWDALVADVHTDPYDPILGDPGAIIHEALGDVHLLLIAVDNGPDRMVYAGPVMSHYEFEMPGSTRLSDADWKTLLRSSSRPPSPEWTRSYLVPGVLARPLSN